MPFVTTRTKNGQMTLPKSIRERLKQLRKDSVNHLKKHGLYGLSDKELKKGISKKRTTYYGQKRPLH